MGETKPPSREERKVTRVDGKYLLNLYFPLAFFFIAHAVATRRESPLMKNIRVYIITASRVKEARGNCIYLYLSLRAPTSSSHLATRDCLLSCPPPSFLSFFFLTPLPPGPYFQATFTDSFMSFFFFASLSESYAPAKSVSSEVPLETRSCNCVLRL